MYLIKTKTSNGWKLFTTARDKRQAEIIKSNIQDLFKVKIIDQSFKQAFPL